MDRSSTSQVQALLKATLFGLVIISLVTWVPHIYSCMKTFVFVCLPSFASIITTPKFLFLFSNIIVIFLANESKLSQMESFTQLLQTEIMRYQIGTSILGKTKEEQEGSILLAHNSMQKQLDDQCVQLDASSTDFNSNDQKGDMVISHGITQQHVDQCVEILDDPSTYCKAMEVGEHKENSTSAIVCDKESEEVEGYGRIVLREDVIEEDICHEEEIGLSTDELNQRVEDFIARFNMERQLEARMIVCCF